VRQVAVSVALAASVTVAGDGAEAGGVDEAGATPADEDETVEGAAPFESDGV